MDVEIQKKAEGESEKKAEEVHSTEKAGVAESPSEEGKTPGMIDKAILAAEELKKQNDRKDELLKKEEALMARKALGGQSEGAKQEEKKEETSKEYRERIEKEMSEGKHND